MSAPAFKSGREIREERERLIQLKHKYNTRITNVKFAKESMAIKDYGTAIKRFTEYLKTISEIKETTDIYSLKPQHFDSKKEVTELLMISHIYFEMARMYDAVPKFQEESRKCLEQFVRFSANQPFQVVNSEMVRKYLKMNIFKSPENFRNAYNQIYVQSKKCYVVTFCYGDAHPVTQEFRAFKEWLLDYRLGQEFVRLYYCRSSVLVEKWNDSSFAHYFGQTVLRPALLVFSKVILPFILRK
jgi:hypothetical protein